jgi:hypothetical protein
MSLLATGRRRTGVDLSTVQFQIATEQVMTKEIPLEELKVMGTDDEIFSLLRAEMSHKIFDEELKLMDQVMTKLEKNELGPGDVHQFLAELGSRLLMKIELRMIDLDGQKRRPKRERNGKG